ncbi:hypothetical protein BJX99DRAFT_253891 [Aspergillus californicus]
MADTSPLANAHGPVDQILPMTDNNNDDGNSDSKGARTTSRQTTTTSDLVPGFPLQRFILRTILLISIPPLIAAYFIVVCHVYRVADPKAHPYGHRNALWVYYSWFVVGVFGLGVSKYGLAGIEAAMLQDGYWHARNAVILLMHGDQSWSGPGGWIRCLGILGRKKGSPANRLWWLLSFLSLMVTVALPMSGLSFELFDGFVKVSHSPLVIGYRPETFNNRDSYGPNQQAWWRWQPGGSSLALPGAGVAYTPQGLDRRDYDYLEHFPNSMSAEQDVPDLFLTPQAKYPVSGSAWGLRLSYNCSVARSVSELTILPRKSTLPITVRALPDLVNIGMGSSITNGVSVYNTTNANLFAYVELGATYHTDYANEEDIGPDILEYAMWQVRVRTSSSNHLNYAFNNTIRTPVSGLGSAVIQDVNGSFAPNTTFLEIQNSTEFDISSNALHVFVANGRTADDHSFLEVAPAPIGVRCQAWSEMGTAKLNPQNMAFSDFVRLPPGKPDLKLHQGEAYNYGTQPFGRGVWSYLYINHKTAFANILDATNAPPPVLFNISQAYPRFLQAENLRKSLMHAYAVDALQLMYDRRHTFDSAAEGQTHIAETLTASQPGKILGPGPIPAFIPIVMFAVWAFGCMSLGLWYGFRRRWAETLDGYSFLRFGADYAHELNDVGDCTGSGLVGHGAEFYRDDKLLNLPGLIGDARLHSSVGRIGLVERGRYARRDKLYV